MGVLTSSAEYTTFVTEMNTAIKNFVKNHSSAVKYSKTENGKSLITLFYGRERDTDLRKIADTIATTLNDASFEIDGLPVTPIKANESVIVFEGDTTAIESAVNSSNEYPILKVLTEQEVSFGNISDVGNNIISNIIVKIARNRSSIPESYFKAANITIDENSNIYGRIGINVPKLDSYLKTLTERITKEQAEIDAESSIHEGEALLEVGEPTVQAEQDPQVITTSTQLLDVKTKFEQILKQSNEVLRIRNKKKSLLTGELETYLASKNVRFERVTAESFVIAYSLEDYSEYFDIKTDAEYSLTNDDEPVKGKTYYLRDEDSDDGNVTYRQAVNTDFDTNYYEGEFEEVDKETETYDSNTTYYVDISGVDVLGPENPSAYRPAVVGENSDEPGDFDIEPDTDEVSFSDGVTYYKKISDPYTKQSFDGQNDYYEKVKA